MPQRYEMTPRRKAFLDTIAYAEGTNRGEQYNIMYTYQTFGGYSDHPRQIQCSGGLCSDAAGRYQFLSTTWDEKARVLGLTDFSPDSQDQAALLQLDQNGSLAAIDAGDFDSAVFNSRATWASFPGANYEGQGMKDLEDLRSVYNEAQQKYDAGAPLSAPGGSGTEPVPSGTDTPLQPQTSNAVVSEAPEPEEDPYLDKCPHLLFRGIITDYGRSSGDGETTLTITGEGYGKIYKDAYILTALHDAELAQHESVEYRQALNATTGIANLYYRLLDDWVEKFWGEDTGWEARTRPIPFPTGIIARFNNEGSVWSGLQYLSMEGFFHIFVDHTGALVWEKLPYSSNSQSLITGRDWEDLPILDCPSWKIINWGDRLSAQGIVNFLRIVPTLAMMSGQQQASGAPGVCINLGSIRQYGGPLKREILMPQGTTPDQWYTKGERREVEATAKSFQDLVVLEAIRWFDRPVQRVSITVRGESAWRIHTRISITEDWHCPDAKPAEYYVVSRSHQIDIPRGQWYTTLELLRDRRTRYLGIGVGDVRVIEPIADVSSKTVFDPNSEFIFDDRFGKFETFEGTTTPLSPDEKTEMGKPVIQYEVPIAPDEYWFYDRFKPGMVKIGNDPIAWADANVVPNLGKGNPVIATPNPGANPPGTAVSTGEVTPSNGAMAGTGKAAGLQGVIPERQVYSSDEQIMVNLGAQGTAQITGGFMEPHGHGWKSETQAIFSDSPQTIQTLPPSNRNVGIDYVVADGKVKSWYSGEVIRTGLEGGYGNRIHVATDVSYNLNGQEYQVFQAYAHNSQLLASPGDRVQAGQQIAIQGGTGVGGSVEYGAHVDLDTYINVNGSRVSLSPNALEAQLRGQK